ncbi:hypothetical protein DL93DRAFT_2091746 [Clavulina sp. PMI_390]|nr:hypothetical protein DL93DRAFT_2091746 [Clavulina sp. PMI_390]
MSSSASRTYEAQNDQQLDDLHSKLRTLRNVTLDIHDETQRQNVDLDNTRDSFQSFGSGFAQTVRNATRAWGGAGGTSQIRMIVYVVGFVLGFWFGWKLLSAVWSWWSS